MGRKKRTQKELDKVKEDAIRIRKEARLIKKQTEELIKKNKPPVEAQRDEKGRLLPGSKLAGAGKPKEAFSLKSMLKQALQEIEPKNQKTYAELLIRKIIKKAIIDEGDFQQKLIWNYLEGMPKQTLEGNIDIKTALVSFIGGSVPQLEAGEETQLLEDGVDESSRTSTD